MDTTAATDQRQHLGLSGVASNQSALWHGSRAAGTRGGLEPAAATLSLRA